MLSGRTPSWIHLVSQRSLYQFYSSSTAASGKSHNVTSHHDWHSFDFISLKADKS